MTVFQTRRHAPARWFDERPAPFLWLAALLVATLPNVASASCDGDTDEPSHTPAASTPDGLTEILNILSSSTPNSEGHGLALAYLVSRGPRAVPAIFAILSGTAAIPGELQAQGPFLSMQRRTMLLDAMRSWDSRRVGHELQVLLEADPSLDRRVVAVNMLGEVAGSRGLEDFLAIVAGFDAMHLAHRSVRMPVVDAMARILQRDPLSYVVLESIVRDLPADPLAVAVEAIADAGRADGVDILELLLDRTPTSDEQVLAAFGCLGQRDLSRVAVRVRSIVRPYLHSGHLDTRLQAIHTLGILKDTESFLDLIGLLEDPEPRVADRSLEALRSISGTSWPAAPDRWVNWFERECAWAEHSTAGLSRTLEDGAPEAAVKAIRELTSHPLFATRIAGALGTGAQHEDRAVAVLACEALGRLRCPEALDPLVEALHDPRSAVRAAAALSLRSSTGQDLPTDGAVWRRWLEG